MKKLIFLLVLSLPLISHGVFAQDLVIFEVTGPKTFNQYAAFSGTITVSNTGIVPTAQSANVRAYLSTDNVFSQDDQSVTYETAPIMEAHTSQQIVVNGEQIKLAPGTYFLIVVVDQNSRVQETNEANNTFVVSDYIVTTPDVDFKFFSLTLDKTFVSRYDILIPGFEVRNTGTTNVAGATYAQFYLSQDQTLDPNDISLEDVYVNFNNVFPDIVQLNDKWNQSMISEDIPAGTYYVIGKIDPENTYTETNELNNTMTAATQVTVSETSNIDLEVDDFILANYHNSPGYSHIYVTYNLKNNGTTGVTNYRVDFYLSLDKDVAALPVYSQYPSTHPSYYIGSGNTQSESQMIDFTYPFQQKPPPGVYYLVIVVNGDHAIPETDYTNNTNSSSSTITIDIETPPQIEFTEGSFNEQYDNADTELSFSLLALNNSMNPAYEFPQYYTLKIRNSLNEVVYSFNYLWQLYTVESQGTQSTNWNIPLETPLPPGSYSVEITCRYDVCFTQPYTLPLVIQEASFTLSGTLQGEDNVPITKGDLFLYQKLTSGPVKFINKITPVTSADFSFSIDTKPHTLYFIPDATLFPDYVPTVYGKTVLLKEESFISALDDVDVTFEILKLVSPPPGARAVSGSAFEAGGSGARVSQLVPIQNLPVILLNESDEPVALVRTDNSGNYQFNNLPEGNYKLVLAFELDKRAKPVGRFENR